MNNNNTCERKYARHYFFLICAIFMVWSCSGNEDFPEKQGEEGRFDVPLTKASFDSDAFVTEWLVPANGIVYLPLDSNYQYNFVVEWGDDCDLSFINNQNLDQSWHRYTKAGVYRIRILGTFPCLKGNPIPSSSKYLVKIVQWGKTHFQTFFSAFYGCEALTSIPAGIPDVADYTGVFKACTSLTSLPDGLFSKCFSALTFRHTFNSCTGLKTLPPNLFADCHNAVSFLGTFQTAGLVSLPYGLFKNCTSAQDFTSVFSWTDLQTIPEDLFQDCVNAQSFGAAFTFTSLTSIPPTLFDHTSNATDFSDAFRFCTSLSGPTPQTNGLELWERAGRTGYPSKINGSYCFEECSRLSTYESIPLEWGGAGQ